jgi:hypothetical protein
MQGIGFSRKRLGIILTLAIIDSNYTRRPIDSHLKIAMIPYLTEKCGDRNPVNCTVVRIKVFYNKEIFNFQSNSMQNFNSRHSLGSI